MRKQVEVTKIDLRSLFKAVIMMAAIPAIVPLFLILISGKLAAVLQVVFMIMGYALVFMILGVSYNWLAPKWGGLILEIRNTEDNQ